MLIDKHRDPEFSQPIRQIFLMVVVLLLFLAGCWFMYPSVAPIFLANLWLNGFILAVFVFGVLACFWQVLTLISSVNWIEGFALDRPGHEFVRSPRLLASLAAMLKDSRARRALTSTSTRSILDSVATRLDEARDITRYIVNLLIFLGLLGTFYGLATSVPAVVETIRSLAPEEGQSSMEIFDRLMTGLEDQLGGMGTAFASSLLGLAGSLVVGLLELFAGHGQNRFYRELEEWLSSITRITLASGDGDASGGDTIISMMEQNALQLETLKDIVKRGEESRQQTDARLGDLSRALTELASERASRGNYSGGPGIDPELMQQMVERQAEMVKLLRLRESSEEGQDAEARLRLRNIDVQLLRILEEMSTGRQDSISELRADLARLTQAILRLAGSGDKG